MKLKMRSYRKNSSTPMKNRIREADHSSKCTQRHLQKLKFKCRNTYKTVFREIEIHLRNLGEDPQQHSRVLAHVLMHTFKSPRKSKSLSEISKFITPRNKVEDQSKYDSKNINKLLQKLTVLRTKSKNEKSKKVVQNLIKKSEKVVQNLMDKGDQSVKIIAVATGHEYSHVYHLMLTLKKWMQDTYK